MRCHFANALPLTAPRYSCEAAGCAAWRCRRGRRNSKSLASPWLEAHPPAHSGWAFCFVRSHLDNPASNVQGGRLTVVMA